MKDSITLYSSPSCPKCQLLRNELGKKGIQFEECHDAALIEARGITKIPTLEVNGELMRMPAALAWLQGRQ